VSKRDKRSPAKRQKSERQPGEGIKTNPPVTSGVSQPAWWNRAWLLGLVLVAATVIAYQPAWRAGFIWDDDVYVVDNPLLTAPDGLRRIWFSLDSPSQYFPLTYTTFRFERALWGLNPSGYHWVNILLHAANAVLLWRLLNRLRLPGGWLAAAVFALHPVHVESVAWITERKNVLSLFFSLLSVRAWVEFIEGPPGRAWRFYVGALLLYALALFSKTTACTLPAALLLLLWLKGKPIDHVRLAQIVPFVLMGLGMGLLAMWWERFHQGTEGRQFATGWLERVLVASRAVWFYAAKLIWPADLAFSYSRWTINTASPFAYVWLAAGAGMCAAIWRLRRSLGRGLEVAVLFFVLTLGPMLGFVMLYTFRYSFVADHYQYVASIGLIALMAGGIASTNGLFGRGNRFLKPAVCGAALLVLGGLTFRQAGLYVDTKSLWQGTLQRNPESWLAHNHLGGLLLNEGKVEEAMAHFQKAVELQPDFAESQNMLGSALITLGRLDEAAARFQKAFELEPRSAVALYNLGVVASAKGLPDQAIQLYQRALEIQPRYAEAHGNLGLMLAQQGQLEEAIVHFRRAVEIKPDAQAHNNLGNALLQRRAVDEAIIHYQAALKLRPDHEQAHNNLGTALLEKGRVLEAIAQYRAALRIRPDYVTAQRILAFVLATRSDASMQNGNEATELVQRADALSGGTDPLIKGTLAAALAAGGRYADAVAAAQQAVQLAAAQNNAMLAEALQKQLELYRSGSPLRVTNQTAIPTSPYLQ
jgi:tetratricopeptide (TPR) repeat protein